VLFIQDVRRWSILYDTETDLDEICSDNCRVLKRLHILSRDFNCEQQRALANI